jgi:hypothetical protein
MKKKGKILIAVFAAVGVLLWFFLWPSPSYYPAPSYVFSRVHPRIQALERPYGRVSFKYYFDRTVGIEIVDARGQRLELGVSQDVGGSGRPKCHHLTLDRNSPGFPHGVDVACSEDTRRYLMEVIADLQSAEHRNFALVVLRGAPRDHLEFHLRFRLGNAANDFQEMLSSIWP